MASSIPPTRGNGPIEGETRDQIPSPAASAELAHPAQLAEERHPPGLYLLFTVEMWERFSYYGMKAFLILFMTTVIAEGGMGWTTAKAATFYGWYTGLAYLTPVIGGYLADKYFGTHRSMVIGGIIIAAGHLTLTRVAHDATWVLITGLALIIIGTGFFKPCVSVMVGQLYKQGDKRRDAAFTIFYMGINLGAFLGPIICGGLRFSQREGLVYGWHWAFGAAGVGMVLGLIAYGIGRPFLLKGVGLPPARGANAVHSEADMCGNCGYDLAGIRKDARCPECGKTRDQAPAVKKPLTKQDKQSIAVICIMSFFVIFFWTAFEQAGSSMNLFAENNVDRSFSPETAAKISRFASDPAAYVHWGVLTGIGAAMIAAWLVVGRAISGRGGRLVLRIMALAIGAPLAIVGILKGTGFLIELVGRDLADNPVYPTEWFQSVNALCILLLAPVFATIWYRLGRMGKEPSTPVKFALGLILLGVGFIFMVLGARESVSGGSVTLVSGYWLVGAYAVHTTGELCLSPIGLSMITKLSPARFVSLMMGVWFLSNFISNLIAGFSASYMDKMAKGEGFLGLGGLPSFFLIFVIAPIAAAIVLFALTPKLKEMIGGRA